MSGDCPICHRPWDDAGHVPCCREAIGAAQELWSAFRYGFAAPSHPEPRWPWLRLKVARPDDPNVREEER